MNNIKFAFIVVSLFITHLIFSQSIEVLHGFEMYYSKVESGAPNYATKYLDNTDPFWKIRIGLTPFPNKKLYTSIGYHTNRSWASLRIGTKEEYLNADGIQGGSSNTTLHRITLGFGYIFKFWSNRIKIRPSINLNFEKTYRTWPDGFRQAYTDEPYSVIISAYSSPGFQVLPEPRTTILFKIFKGLHLQLEYSYLFGSRPSMYIEGEFTINGVPQPLARNYNDGTSQHFLIGLNYTFGDNKK